MGVIVGASLIISMIAVVAGWMGSHDYLGFTVMSRAYVPIFGGLFKVLTKLQIMGMLGGFWPVLNRIVTACIW
jgi:NCS1 family nucleobase:cation symporter-1